MDWNIVTLLVFVFVVSAMGGLTQTVAGFGCGITVMLFLPLMMPLLGASALNSVICSVQNLCLAWGFRKGIKFKLVLFPAFVSFFTSAAAVYLAVRLNLHFLKILFSLSLIALAIYFIFFADRVHVKASVQAATVCSALSGFVNGFFGVGGPPMALYYLTVTKTKEEYIGTAQFYFLIVSLFTTGARAAGGIISPDVLMTFLPGVLGVLAGQCIGIRIVHRLSIERMKKIIYAFLAISGVLTLIDCF